MLEMPQRSVTRFFIPMIDVLTLLFCIYLLMPMVSPSDVAQTEKDRLAREERLRQLEAELARKATQGDGIPAQLREEIERLRKEKIEALRNRLNVRVLEIDPATGFLYFRDPDRVRLASQADALRLIERDRQARSASRGELYYLILYPRESASAFPTVEQRKSYDRWFEGVALGYDIPGNTGSKEK